MAFLCPEHAELHRYWRSLCANNALPLWREFEPARVPGDLPFLMILKVRPPGEIAVCLWGEKLTTLVGVNLTGKSFMSLTDGANRPVRQRILEQVFRDGRPTLAASSMMGAERQVPVEELYLPTVNDERQIERVLASVRAVDLKINGENFNGEQSGAWVDSWPILTKSLL